MGVFDLRGDLLYDGKMMKTRCIISGHDGYKLMWAYASNHGEKFTICGICFIIFGDWIEWGYNAMYKQEGGLRHLQKTIVVTHPPKKNNGSCNCSIQPKSVIFCDTAQHLHMPKHPQTTSPNISIVWGGHGTVEWKHVQITNQIIRHALQSPNLATANPPWTFKLEHHP